MRHGYADVAGPTVSRVAAFVRLLGGGIRRPYSEEATFASALPQSGEFSCGSGFYYFSWGLCGDIGLVLNVARRYGLDRTHSSAELCLFDAGGDSGAKSSDEPETARQKRTIAQRTGLRRSPAGEAD